MKKDYYSRKARQEGYLARSVYKLKQLNKKYNLIKRNDTILDLGCFPGGWIQCSLEIVGDKGHVTGIDLNDVDVKGKNFSFYKIDAFSDEVFNIGNKFDAVISDMAPKTTGIKDLDRARSAKLAYRALEIAKKKLKPSGNFLAKVFQGEDFIGFLNECKKHFNFVKSDKPEASKRKSVEMYVVCKNFRA